MLSESDRRTYLARFRRPGLENLQRLSLVKAVNTLCRKVIVCPYCASINGIVKKGGTLKIVHDKYRAKKTADEMDKFKTTFKSAVEFQKELGIYINKAVIEELNPLKVLDLFQRISDEVRFLVLAVSTLTTAKDCELLGMKPVHGRPEQYVWQYMSVPPVCIRPSVAQDGGSNEDDLTVKLAEIVFSNTLIKQGIQKGAPIQQLMVRRALRECLS